MNNKKILIVDDDEETRNVMSYWFKQRGYNVDSSSNGKDALEHIKGDSYSMAFVDLRMPGMSGFELVERLRENRCKVSKLALMSGSWTPEQRRQADDLGCAVFVKPFQLSEILHWLQRCESEIGARKTTRRLARVG